MPELTDYQLPFCSKAAQAALVFLRSPSVLLFFQTLTTSDCTMAAVQSANLVLWSARVCPWAQRATLALQETGLDHTIKEIDLQAKPDFYNEKINPASKVPVLQIGGRDEEDVGVPRIPESAVLLELISDLAKARGARALKPDDPIETGGQCLTAY